MIIRPVAFLTTLVRRGRKLLAGTPRPVPSLDLSSAVPVVRHDLDPTEHARDFRQPDQVSCGASSLVFSRMVHDRAYAARILAIDDPARRTARWTAEVRAMHRQITGLRDHDGDLQWPWLRVVGTSPWGAARQMQGGEGRSGLAGARYGARTLDPTDPGAEFDRISAAVRSGHTLPLYVGNALRPAHVVLVVSAEAERVGIYEPSTGRMVGLTRDGFVAGTFSLGGWSVPWFAVLPR